jgi:hypothetical protein
MPVTKKQIAAAEAVLMQARDERVAAGKQKFVNTFIKRTGKAPEVGVIVSLVPRKYVRRGRPGLRNLDSFADTLMTYQVTTGMYLMFGSWHVGLTATNRLRDPLYVTIKQSEIDFAGLWKE